MNEQYQEPSRFSEQDEALYNFSDLSNRTKIKEKGLFSEVMPHPVNITVTVRDMDELVQVVEQDYYLKKILWPKFEYIAKEKDIFDATCRLVEVYLSISHIESAEAKQVNRFVLSNLNLI